MTPPTRDVVFACGPDGNRALIAAALAQHLCRDLRVRWSCAQMPTIHPYTLVVLDERGARADHLECLRWTDAAACELLVVLTGETEYPPRVLAARRETLCWPTPSPTRAPFASPPITLAEFRHLRDHLEACLWQWLESTCLPGEP